MRLIRAPDDLVNKLIEASNRQGKTLHDYITETFEQAVRADELDSSLKKIIDYYERAREKEFISLVELARKEALKRKHKTSQLDELSALERLFASKLRPESKEKREKAAEEREMLNTFLSQLSRESTYGKRRIIGK